MQCKYFGLGRMALGLRNLLARIGLASLLALGATSASATHVALLLDGGIASGGIGNFYSLDITFEGDHWQAAGALYIGDMVPEGRRAVGLLGFDDDYVLIDAQAATEVDTGVGPPELIQPFTLLFYKNPVNPSSLLDGYATSYLVKTPDNLCPSGATAGMCWLGAFDYFDITDELGHFPDTLQVGIRTDVLPIPSPGSASLAGLALLALGLVARRQSAGREAARHRAVAMA